MPIRVSTHSIYDQVLLGMRRNALDVETVEVREVFSYTTDPEGKYGRAGFVYHGKSSLLGRFADAGLKVEL